MEVAVDEALRTELIGMFDADQAAVADFLAKAEQHRDTFEATQTVVSHTPWPYVLLEWSPAQDAPATVQRVLDVVRRNADRLREIVDAHGWPGRSLVGEDGADAAWLILQHAGSGVPTIGTPEHDAFRRSCVPLLERAVQDGEAHPRHLAWTVDGIRSVTGEPPEYAVLATDYAIVNGEPVFRSSVDLAAIERRRAGIGLPSLGSDVARRSRGERLHASGPHRAEPWPDRRHN